MAANNPATAPYPDIIAAKRQALAVRKAKTPIEAIRALASMQKRPPPVLSTVTNEGEITLIGHLRYRPPTDTLAAPYDPVSRALRFIRQGADAVALFTDFTIYQG
ncbi:MAG: hypothetical protein GYB67_11575, partial [Chloroflexi bacterium]|nr:hypothetical protein [Chloroflexota bacterium]